MILREELENISKHLKSIMYSENRLANYIEGRTLFTFDEINTVSCGSLYQDMRDAVNDKERAGNNFAVRDEGQ